jgi:hypothetical protein
MSLYAVERPTRVQEVHCVGPPDYSRLTTPDVVVWTRFGGLCRKSLPVRRARQVGGRIRDLNTGRIVFQA